MERRTGDTIAIGGDYQHKAITEGPPIQRFWHAAKQRLITAFLPPAPDSLVLDVGCGSGVISAFLGGFGAEVIGLDGNTEAINFASRTYGQERVSFQNALVDSHFQIERPVDAIYCLEVIEHIHEEQARVMLEQFHRLLRPGGHVFLSTPNYHSVWPLIEFSMDRLSLAPKMGGDQHVCWYHASRLRAVCEAAGFQVELTRTNCLLAPWLAPFSWRLAEKTHDMEVRLPGHMGCILFSVLVKPF